MKAMKMTMKMSHPMMTTLAASLSQVLASVLMDAVNLLSTFSLRNMTCNLFVHFLYLRTQENECRGGLRRTNHRTDIIATAPVNSLVINP